MTGLCRMFSLSHWLRFCRLPSGETCSERLRIVGLRRSIQLWLVQRLLRVNASVPWPVHWTSHISFADRIMRVDPTTYPGLSPSVHIQAMNGVRIGRNLRLGPGAKVISANHNLTDYLQHVDADPIIIGDNVWIGANACILPGVRLGNHVVVAAGAVVTKSFDEDDILIAGVPARKLRDLPPYEGAGRIPAELSSLDGT